MCTHAAVKKKQQNDEFFNIPMLHLSTNFHKNISAWKLVPKCANRQKKRQKHNLTD